MQRRMSEPQMPDHAHWYRVIGATYLRVRRAAQLDKLAELQAAMREPPALTDQERYRRWLES